MRDSDIIGQVSNLKNRIGIIYRQMVFLDARLQAFEGVFQNSTWFQRLFRTKALMQRVDALHLGLMQKHDEDLRRKEQQQRSSLVKPNGVHV